MQTREIREPFSVYQVRNIQSWLEKGSENGYNMDFAYSILVSGEDDCLRCDHLQLDAAGLDLPAGQGHL